MPASGSPARTPSPESTLALIERAKAGDTAALDCLLTRYRPRLSRWAHRRLPVHARSLTDTDDLVQITLLKTVRSLHGFTPETDAAFQNYLRRAVSNAIRDEIRKTQASPAIVNLDPGMPSADPSPLEHVVGRRRLARYEAALARLTPAEHDVVVARLEFGLTHAELAEALGKETPDAARKVCKKALGRLLTLMGEPNTQLG